MQTIVLKRDHHLNAWMAKHSDPEVQDLFGTDTLTTPYRSSVHPEFVRDEVQRRNPDCIVSIVFNS